MIRAHKIRLNLTDEQAAFLTTCCHISRAAYNWGLAEWNRQYKAGGKPSVMQLKKQWNAEIDTAHPWAREGCRDAYAQAFFNLGDAFSRFFSGQNKRPDFKRRGKAKMAFCLANDKFRVSGNTATLPKIGDVNMAEALRFAGKIMSGNVALSAGHWYLSIAVEMQDVPRKATGQAVGIDVGLKTLAVTSDGEQLENQKPLKNSLGTLRRLSRTVSRRKLGSKNRDKAKLKLARFHARIADRRRDVWHKFTTDMARRYDTVCIEDLNVKGMGKNRRLSRALADAGWSGAFAMLDYKCADVRRVPTFAATSKPCHVCGKRKEDLTLSDRVWLCECGNVVERDLNAAKNIKQIGLVQPLKSPTQAVASLRVKRPRIARKTQLVAKQVEVDTEVCAHIGAH